VLADQARKLTDRVKIDIRGSLEQVFSIEEELENGPSKMKEMTCGFDRIEHPNH
jgi:hypothetical protein